MGTKMEQSRQEAINKTVSEKEGKYIKSEWGANRLYPKVQPRTVIDGFKESVYVDVVGQKIKLLQYVTDLWSILRST